MKKTAWSLLVFVSLALATRAQQTNLWAYSEELGLWVGIIEDKKPTEEERFRRKMRDALPYQSEVPEALRHSTLGQLSKVSDYIVVGRVAKVKAVTNSREDISVTLKLDSVLLGTLSSKKITVTSGWPEDAEYKMRLEAGYPFMWNWKFRPKRGDRLLMYLFDRSSIGHYWDSHKFHSKKEERAKTGLLHLVRGNMGVRFLDTPENTADYLDAAKGYLEELRGGKRDEESYYALLRRLVQSPVQGIREDARSDLMFFIEYCPSFDARRVLTDDNIDEAIKYWVEHSVLPPREKQQPAAQNEP
jgi:hypothetical protein